MNSSPPKPLEEQLPTPMFRLLGPDPIYNFEQDVRPASRGCIPWNPLGSQGGIPNGWPGSSAASVKSRAWGSPMPMWDRRITSWWENIRPGLGPQLALLRELADRGAVRVGDHGGLCRLVPEPV